MIRILIVASFLGSLLPRESFSSIISKGDMPAQKCSQGLPLKFQDGTFGAIKIFGKFFSPEVLPDVNWKFQCLGVVSKPPILHGWAHNFY